MSQNLSVILIGSCAALSACLAYRMMKRGQTRRMASAIAMGLAIAVVAVIAPRRADTRGAIDQMAPVVICYLSMLLGMMAEIGFTRAERRDLNVKVDRMTVLLPVFASPIVFIPLLTLMTDDAMAGGAFRQAKLMVYLVAFQNGFFWKSFFEQRRVAAHAGASVPAAT